MMKNFLILALLVISTVIFAQTPNSNWQTKYEQSGYVSTAGYDESIEYFKRLAENSSIAKLVQFGTSPQGRKLYYFIVDQNSEFNPNTKSKPVVFLQNGIHAGEIEGKDASMMLLREILITKEKYHLIENVTFIIIPVLNVDGHERISKYNRINQNGPLEMGWRATAQNLNLNRDYTKADAPEMQAFLKLFSKWLPDVYIDSHTTNGLDFQYVLTYGIEKHQNVRSPIRNWIRNEFNNYFESELKKRSILTAPYFSYDQRNPSNGVTDWVSSPRFSHGYAAYQNRIGLLLETHMLKPYKERVDATKKAIEVVLEYVNENPKKIKNISQASDTEAIEDYFNRDKALPLQFESTQKFDEFSFHGLEADTIHSDITDSKLVEYSGREYVEPIEYYSYKNVVDSVGLPKAYIIPREWSGVVDRMKLHDIDFEEISEEQNIVIERYKFSNVKFAESSYEGRQRVNADYIIEQDTITTNVGDYYVTLNQRSAPLIGHLLEPKATDSFLRWGFFNTIFERKEYFEYYSMQPIAQEMLESDEELREEFYKKIEKDEDFKNSPWLRMNFFYERSPYFDKKYNVYPVLRVLNEL